MNQTAKKLNRRTRGKYEREAENLVFLRGGGGVVVF